MHVKEIFLAIFVVFSAGKVTCLPTANNGQGDVYGLNAVADVWLEDSYNKNSYSLLLLGTHASYLKKRSLLRFDDIPSACKTINYASMYISTIHTPTRLVGKVSLKHLLLAARYKLTEC